MHPLLSEALREAYASCSDAYEVYSTIEITVGTLRYGFCSGNEMRTSKLENGESFNWMPAPFKIQMPTQASTGASALSLSIENVDGLVVRMVEYIKASVDPVYVKYRTYLVGYDYPQNPRPLKLELIASSATLTGVVFQATIPDIVNRSFPNAYYSYAAFPGLRV